MLYSTNTQVLYYNSQFDLDKVKEEIFRIGNLQAELKENLKKKLKQVYDSDEQQQESK
jgi:hypothetical protein